VGLYPGSLYSIIRLVCSLLIHFKSLRKIAKSNKEICHVSSVRLVTWNNAAPNVRIFMEFYIWEFFRNYVETVQFSLKSEKNKRCIYANACTCLIFLRMGNVSERSIEKRCIENQNTILCSVTFFENRAFRKITWVL
jgi:hypothetical protein